MNLFLFLSIPKKKTALSFPLIYLKEYLLFLFLFEAAKVYLLFLSTKFIWKKIKNKFVFRFRLTSVDVFRTGRKDTGLFDITNKKLKYIYKKSCMIFFLIYFYFLFSLLASIFSEKKLIKKIRQYSGNIKNTKIRFIHLHFQLQSFDFWLYQILFSGIYQK